MTSLVGNYVAIKLDDGALPWAIVEQAEFNDPFGGRIIDRFTSSGEANLALKKMLDRRAAVIVVTNGRLGLISRRTMSAKIYQGMFQYAGGKANPGEGVRACAVRELQEETGIVAHPYDLGYLGCLGVPPGGRYEGHGFILYVKSDDLHAEQKEPQNADPWTTIDFTTLMRLSPGTVIPGFLTLTAMVHEYLDRYCTWTKYAEIRRT